MEEFIEFPVFDGVSGDMWQWILWLEDFFVREKFTADEKMNLAQSLLDGKAYAWFYRNQKIFSIQSWEELRDMLWLMFGDVADSCRIRRRKTTSIPAKDSIWETETEALVPTDTIPVMNWPESRDSSAAKASIEKDESSSAQDELISQYQVPVSSLEPNLSFSSEPLEVSASWPCEVVSNNLVLSQSDLACVKTMNNAHHVFDEMLLRRHKFQQRKKPSLSPKSRMFKFKQRTLLSNWSLMDLHQVIDSSKVNHLPCFSANFGWVRQHRTIQCLRLKKQAHKSRVLFQLRMLHDPGGKNDEHSDDIFETEVNLDKVQSTPMDTSSDNVATFSNDVAPSTDVIIKKQTPACAVVKYSEPATYVKAMHTEGWDEAYDAEIDALEGTGTCFVTSLPARCGWLVFDRGKNGQIQWTEIQTISLYKEMVADPIQQAVLNRVTDAARLGNIEEAPGNRLLAIKQKETVSAYVTAFEELSAQFHSLEFQLKHKWRSKHLYPMSALEFHVVERIGVVVFKAQPLPREIAAVLDSFDHDFMIVILVVVDRFSKAANVLGLHHPFKPGLKFGVHQQMQSSVPPALLGVELLVLHQRTPGCFSKDFVRLYPTFKLEDKLIFQGGSIDMNHEAYHRKNKKKIGYKEALG